MVLIAFAIVVTGGILRYKPIIAGGVVFAALALACSYLPLQQQLLTESIAWLVAFIIPGHILYANRRSWNMMFKDLDPLLHSQVRLAVMSILLSVKTAEFSFLLENINTTKGNLSFQLTKLKEAGYIKVKKSFRGSYPLTTCMITEKGHQAYEAYFNSMTEYFRDFKTKKRDHWKASGSQSQCNEYLPLMAYHYLNILEMNLSNILSGIKYLGKT